ncbi:hypothetical protein ACA910_014460 [Epithemia clementina (nom. ined.)]
MDLSDLTSKPLPSLWGGSGSTPTHFTATVTGGVQQSQASQSSWNRSMASLQAASQALLEQQGGAFGGAAGVGGIGLRSRFKTAAAATGGGAANAGAPFTPHSSGAATSTTIKSIEELISEHEEGILQRLGQEFRDAIDKDVENEIDDYLESTWDRQHKQWLEDIGVGGGHHKMSREGSSNHVMSDSTNIRGGRSNTSATTVLSSGGHNTGGSRSSVWQQPQNRHNMNGVKLDPQLIQAHGQIVQDLPRFQPDEAAREFGRLVQRFLPTVANQPIFRGYATAWDWMGHVLQYQQQQQNDMISGSGQNMDTVDQAIGTLIHLCQLFKIETNRLVEAAVHAGQADLLQDTYKHPVAKACQAFTKLVFGSAKTTTTTDPWPVLYFCLRCGSGEGAFEVWQMSKSLIQISDTVSDSITQMLKGMEPWEKVVGPPQVPRAHRHIVADYLQSLEQQQHHPSGDGEDDDDGNNNFDNDEDTGENNSSAPPSVHQIGFLALLSGMGSLPIDNNARGFNTIEDFLFGRISSALLQRDPQEELANLGRSIQDYGANYFGDAESGGWSYAIPLLMTQQYSKALTHLVEEGSNLGLLQAAHLGLLMSSNWIPLTDLGQPNDEEEQDDLAASLLVAYAGRLLAEPTAGSLAAFEYLSLIPRRDRMRKEVATLIAKTRDLENLVGKLDPNGIRYGGYGLDRKFAKDEIVFILGDAAEMLLRDSHGDNEKMGAAAMCYMLAGRYDSVLRFLCDMLYPPNLCYDNNNNNNRSNFNDDNNTAMDEGALSRRHFWLDQTRKFHEHYLRMDKPTEVAKVLERSGKQNLIQTSHWLMELNVFFQHMRDSQFYEAWTVASRIQLLPVDRSDMHAKQDMYRSGLDETIKRSFPSFLVAVMECLYRQHAQTKQQQQHLMTQSHNNTGSSGVAFQRLVELQEYARLLVTFAGMLNIASDQLSQLEAKMV